MYTRSKSVLASNSVSSDRYIEDKGGVPDIANSTLLYYLDNCSERNIYTITKYEGRIDLISEEIYTKPEYSWILMYTNRITSLDELTLGRDIEYIPMNKLNAIFKSI
jgi:hypothetical protein|nr:MAG TPA: hypothetical protein [Caudoviricetes sp.]